MFCLKCGKELPNDAKFCNYCGAPVSEGAPRHARPEPEPEEIFSFSDKNTRIYDPADDVIDESTKVFDPAGESTRVYGPVGDSTRVFEPADAPKDYHFENFEGTREPMPPDGYDDREFIGDSYDNYTDGEDDRTFMDKLDDRFRRDDEYKKPRNLTWLWIVLSAAAVVLFAVIIVMAVTASNRNKGNTLPTAAPTVAATAAPTVPATEAPAPTDPPETEPPET